MRILDVSPIGVYPPRGGGHVRINSINLAEAELGHEINLFAQGIRRFEMGFPIRSWDTTVCDGYTEHRHLSYSTVLLYAVTNLLKVPPVLSDLSLRVTRPAILEKWIRRADLVKIEHPWQFPYVSKIARSMKKPLVLVEQDFETKLQREMGSGVFSEYFNRRIREVEEKALNGSDIILTASEQDRLSLIDEFDIPEKDMWTVPNGVDTRLFVPSNADSKSVEKKRLGIKGKLAIFVGSRHPPNIEAAKSILQMAGRPEMIGVDFVLIGRVCEGLSTEGHTNVHLMGLVDDLKPYYKAADMAICPLSSGSGTSIKTLEYMAAGVPVISTPVGARGLEVRDGQDLLVRDLPDFADAILELASDERSCSKLATSARDLVERSYDWMSIAKREIALFESLIG